MNQNFRTLLSSLIASGMVLTIAGAASADLLSAGPTDALSGAFGDPLGDSDGFGDLPIIDDEFDLPGGMPDMRGHSDVPDLPDSTTDGEEGQNSLLLDGSFPGPSWEPQDPGLDFEDAFADVFRDPHEVAPVLVNPSPVPGPGGIGVLTVVALATAARRRR